MASKLYTYTPLSVGVYQFSNNKNAYAYDLDFQLNYDNVPIDASNSADAPTLDSNDMFSNKIHLSMFTPSSIDWIWSSPIGFEAPTIQEECELTIDFDDACRIISERLSQDHVFKIKKAELIYSVRAVYNDSEQSPSTEYIIEPSWQFSFATGTQEYGRLCANVNAVNGNLNLRQLV